ncbi:MAG: hypothetical protein ACI91Z_000961 [Yoonia sp.]|jgi:uncharacterized protein (DUF4415 family)
MSPKMTAKQQQSYTDYVEQMYMSLGMFRHPDLAQSLMPEEWRDLARKEVPKKQPVTLRIDADVLRFFRKIGAGYQAEINGVLRAFMLARLAEILGAREETQIEEPDEVTSGTIEIEANMVRDLENFRKMRLGL